MKKVRINFFVLLLFLFSGIWPVYAGLEEGLTAYNSGDYKAALKEYMPLAEQGDADAQVRLAMMYEKGQGFLRNNVMAYMWFNLAASQGDELAALMREVIEKKMSKEQVAEAQKLSSGSDLKSIQGAVPYEVRPSTSGTVGGDLLDIKIKAFAGDADAQYTFGFIYYTGEEVTKDVAEAFYWFKRAAEQEHVIAQNILGMMYAKGEGIPGDSARAIYWYRIAAEHGYADAQHSLGMIYGTGKGVPKDYVQAYRWINLAAIQGLESARERLGKVSELMTKEQINDAEKLSKEFKVIP